MWLVPEAKPRRRIAGQEPQRRLRRRAQDGGPIEEVGVALRGRDDAGALAVGLLGEAVGGAGDESVAPSEAVMSSRSFCQPAPGLRARTPSGRTRPPPSSAGLLLYVATLEPEPHRHLGIVRELLTLGRPAGRGDGPGWRRRCRRARSW